MRLRITHKLLIYLMLISVLPLLLLSSLSYLISSSILLTEVETYNRELVASEREQMDLTLEQIKSLIFNISGVQEIREVIDQKFVDVDDAYVRLSTQARIGNILNGYSSIQGLVSIDIFTGSGIHFHVGDTLNTENINEDIQQSLFDQISNGTSTIVWTGIEPNVNEASAYQQVVTAGRLLTRVDRETMQQEVSAMLLVNFSVEEFYNRLYNIDLGREVQLMIVDADGLIVAHPDRSRIGQTFAPSLLSRITDAKGTFTVKIEGIDTLVSYNRSDLSGWLVLSATPLAALNAKTDTLRITTLLTLLMSLSIVVAVAYVLNLNFVHPIRVITQRLQDLQAGRLDPKMYMERRSNDEIGDLIHGFNLFLESQEAKRLIEVERERLIQELQIARGQAEESNRLKSEFLSTMSHELRTPLNAIEGYAGIMLYGMGVEVDAKTRNMVERISANSKRLLSLINDILDLSRIESGRVMLSSQPIAPREMVRRWQTQLSVLGEKKNITFETTIADDLPKLIYGDEEAISKIAVNLLGNAFKFTHQGKVTLRLERREDKWAIEVSDTGIGISPEAQVYIFDEFRQVDQSSKRSYGGTGLGLAIVKKLAMVMGGSVSLKSEVEKGSIFTVLLPLRSVEGVKEELTR